MHAYLQFANACVLALLLAERNMRGPINMGSRLQHVVIWARILGTAEEKELVMNHYCPRPTGPKRNAVVVLYYYCYFRVG